MYGHRHLHVLNLVWGELADLSPDGPSGGYCSSDHGARKTSNSMFNVSVPYDQGKECDEIMGIK